MFRFLDNAAMVHPFGGHFVVGCEILFQRGQADFDPLLLENIGKTAFGQTAMQGHLATLETDLHRIAGTRLLSLFTAAGSLPQPRARSTPETFLAVRRTLGRM